MLLLSENGRGSASGVDRPAPRVSVVIPAYKAESMIGSAIATIAAQSFTNFELIVVDDASPDGTAGRICEALQTAGFPYVAVQLKKNAGPSIARNVGVSLARGDYVAFLDADDTWLPSKLERQVDLMDHHPEVSLCSCQADLCDLDGAVIRPLYHDVPSFQPDGWKRLLWHSFVNTSCVVVRRADLGTRPFDPTLRVAEDRDLWIRLASNGSVALVQQVLVRKVEYATSYMASNQMLVALDTKRMIDFHVGAMRDYLTRRERLAAYGSLHSNIGKGLSVRPGCYLKGARHLLMAIGMGFNVFDNGRHLILSAPAVRAARALIRRYRPAPG